MVENNAHKYYQTRYSYDDKRKVVWKEICAYLQKEIPAQSRVLDLGAGYCDFINNITAREKYALDVSESFTVHAYNNIKTFIKTCSDLKIFDDDFFDIVFTSNLFEHISRSDFIATIHEIKRILKRNGKLIVIQPNFKYCYKEYFDDYTHLQVFTHVSFTDVLKANGFSINKLEPRFIPFSMKSARYPVFGFLVRLYLFLPVRPFAGSMLVIANPEKEK